MSFFCPHTRKRSANSVRMHDLDTMAPAQCVALLQNVVEARPDAAHAICEARPHHKLQALLDVAQRYLDNLPPQEKEGVLKGHPDLGTEDTLTTESLREQFNAGLQDKGEAIVSNIRELSARYKSKFGFPFVICARENKTSAILEGLNKRLENSRDEELVTGICEVKKICTLRIKDLVED